MSALTISAKGSLIRKLHTMVRVGGLAAALEFFCKKLELVEISRMDNEKGRFSLTFLAAPDDVAMAHDSAWRLTASGR